MKKLSVLIALILCVTIGGVYAAWSYTGSTMTAVDRTLSHGLTAAVSEGDVGVFAITHNDIDVSIDQTAKGDYTAKLVISGSVTVTFTPNDGAPADVIDNAIPAEAILYTKNAEDNQYLGSNIYTVNDGSIDLSWTKGADGVFTATITAAQIDTLLDLGNTFVLDTLSEYNAFHALEEGVTITLAVQQKTASN